MGLRKSGIEGIGMISWGTHISQVYNTKDEYLEIFVPYIREGLLNNELCTWIYSSDTDLEDLFGYMRANIPGFDEYVVKKQLMLIPCIKWYSFNGIRVIKEWIDLIQQAQENGYDGLRAVIDISWLEKSYIQSLSEYENNINALMSELPFIAACLYDVTKIDLLEFAEIINNHIYIILKENDEYKIIKNIVNDAECTAKIVGVRKDIKKTDELLRRTFEYDRIKTEFFSNLSHELRTPLNVILSAVQLMKTFRKDEHREIKEESCLNIIQQNCYRLLRLVNNLIDITRINSEFFELNLKNCNIVDLVEKITMSVSRYVESKGILLKFDTNTEEKYLACDPEQMERIILNLLSNAVKFTPSEGRIWVKVTDLRKKIVISVKDTGIGIPKEKQKHIFDKFQQVNKSFTRPCEGSGIGLSLVKSLVEKHGGKVGLKSREGKGSNFILEFPCYLLDEMECSPDTHYNMNYKQLDKAQVEFSDIYSFGM